MQEPPELAGPLRALVHERLTVGHKQSEVTLETRERRHRQLGVGQRRPGHRLGIDRVGLAAHPVGPASQAIIDGAHAHRAFPARRSGGAQRSGDVTAVLHGEGPLRSRVAGPARGVARTPWCEPQLELAKDLRPVAASIATAVWVCLCGSIPTTITPGPPFLDATHRVVRTTGGHASVGLKQAPMKSRRQAFAGGGRHNAWRSSRSRETPRL